ncbi:hypothetical protein HK096_009336, partial [Nowakowskiella sp. JEL0078]
MPVTMTVTVATTATDVIAYLFEVADIPEILELRSFVGRIAEEVRNVPVDICRTAV